MGSPHLLFGLLLMVWTGCGKASDSFTTNSGLSVNEAEDEEGAPPASATGGPGPLFESQSYSYSSSSSMAKGADGKMHREVQAVKRAETSDGSRVHRAEAALECRDGRCKGAARRDPSKFKDNRDEEEGSALSDDEGFPENSGGLSMAPGMGPGFFGGGDSLLGGGDMPMVEDVANGMDARFARMEGGMGQMMRTAEMRMEEADPFPSEMMMGGGGGDEGRRQFLMGSTSERQGGLRGSSAARSKSFSRSYSSSSVNGVEQKAEAVEECHGGDCGAAVRECKGGDCITEVRRKKRTPANKRPPPEKEESGDLEDEQADVVID